MPFPRLRRLKRLIGKSRLTAAERRHALVGPADLWESKRAFQIGFLRRFGLKPEHHLLDVGCGTLRGGIPLIAYLEKSHYVGIEVRAEVLNEGRKELAKAGLEWKAPTLLFVPDISQACVAQRFDFIWAFSVLFHMSDQVLDGAFRFVSQHLSADGVFFANVRVGERKDGKWKGLSAVWRNLEFYDRAGARHGMVVSDLGPLIQYGHTSHVADPNCQRMLKITAAH
jgi:cyclopropane fatty-acyl-phospholipid synthase-like methyltransferase